MRQYNKEFRPLAQNLRKNMTRHERKLWYEFLAGLSVKFNRQAVIENYIVDFYCPSKSLVVELDGSQHYEEEGQKSDIERDKRLCELGYKVLRYSNIDIDRRFDAVCKDIYFHLGLTD